MNNDQRVIQKIKNKVNLIKHVNDLSKIIFHKAVVTQSVNHSKSDHLKSRDAILTNVKKADVLVETCFICHKSDHSSKKCSDQSTRINAVNYQKLNVIFKRNRYSLSLIDEIIDKIVSCKHLTKLNIISAFNKL